MDIRSVRNVVQVKVVLSATLTKVAAILDRQSGWKTEDELIATYALKVKLACEYTTTELEAAQQLCEQIIGLPPPYAGSHPDEQLHKLFELHARLESTSNIIEGLCESIQLLHDECENEEAMKEAQERAKDTLEGVEEASNTVPKIITEVQKRILDQLIGPVV